MTIAIEEYNLPVFSPDEKKVNDRYLGPARVLKTKGRRLLLELPEENIWAQSAIIYPYKPVPGDTVLAIGQDGDFYMIGILTGTGKTTFSAPGDIKFSAPSGHIDMVSAKGFRLRSPQVKLISDNLEFTAKTIVEKFDSARRWVKNTFKLRAGRVSTQVESTYRIKAEKIVERAKGDVKIDGNKIHLG